jgi:hypothetical protein
LAAIVASFFAAGGCGVNGKVNQGRVVAYDAAQGLVTLVADSNFRDPANPRFDVLPAEVVRIPVEPAEMGPAPEAGGLLGLDLETGLVSVYDPATRGIKSLRVEVAGTQERVFGDDPRVTRTRYPAIDREKGTVTIYLRQRRMLVTLKAAPELLDLPVETWRAGDEVRYYYKNPGQALRMMNVTKTDVSKAGK